MKNAWPVVNFIRVFAYSPSSPPFLLPSQLSPAFSAFLKHTLISLFVFPLFLQCIFLGLFRLSSPSSTLFALQSADHGHSGYSGETVHAKTIYVEPQRPHSEKGGFVCYPDLVVPGREAKDKAGLR